MSWATDDGRNSADVNHGLSDCGKLVHGSRGPLSSFIDPMFQDTEFTLVCGVLDYGGIVDDILNFPFDRTSLDVAVWDRALFPVLVVVRVNVAEVLTPNGVSDAEKSVISAACQTLKDGLE